MEWYVFAFLAPAFWAMNNVFIKFLITNKFRSCFPTIFLIALMDAIFALTILTVTPISVNFPHSIVAFVVGLMPLIAFWFYWKALNLEEVTRIITLYQLIPVFTVFLSTIFLNEVLGIQRYFGIALIVIAAVLISYKKSSKKSFSRAIKFMIPFGIITAMYTVSDKFLLNYLDFWSLFFWNVLGTFCGVAFLLSSLRLRKELAKTVSAIGKRALFITFAGEGLYVSGTICSLVALSMANASLVSAVFGLQPLYGFLYTLFLSLFLPQLLKEEISKPILSLKISAIALTIIGIWIVL